MLGALDESLRAQRQLVADASHELRTPLTSLRTNGARRSRRASAAERRRALDDAQVQITELSALVADVVELAARVSRSRCSRTFVSICSSPPRSAAWSAAACRSRSFRAWVRWSFAAMPIAAARGGEHPRQRRQVEPPGAAVEVDVGPQGVLVRDFGPGIAPEDGSPTCSTASTARRPPGGSGLGLAIVRRVAELHGGSVTARGPPLPLPLNSEGPAAGGGGTLVRLQLAPA